MLKQRNWVGRALGAAVGLAGAMPALAQPAVPEVVRPRSDGAEVPPRAGSGPAAQPRSENPLVEGPRPVPDGGVVAPPVPGAGAVIRPPPTNDLAIVPPPGSAGGNRAIVPK